MKGCLQELSSQNESRNLVGELSEKLANHSSRPRELALILELADGEVSLRVLISLLAHQPLEVDIFPGILEGLAGRLGLAPPSTTNPARSC